MVGGKCGAALAQAKTRLTVEDAVIPRHAVYVWSTRRLIGRGGENGWLKMEPKIVRLNMEAGLTVEDAVLHRLGLLVDAEDGAGGDVGVDVGGAVERVEDSHVLGADVRENLLVLALAARHAARDAGRPQRGWDHGCRHRTPYGSRSSAPQCPKIHRGTTFNQPVSVLVEDGGVLLLRGNDSDLAGELQGTLDHIIGDNVEFLLLLALFTVKQCKFVPFSLPHNSIDLHVDTAASTLISDHSSDGSAVDQVRNGLARLS